MKTEKKGSMNCFLFILLCILGFLVVIGIKIFQANQEFPESYNQGNWEYITSLEILDVVCHSKPVGHRLYEEVCSDMISKEGAGYLFSGFLLLLVFIVGVIILLLFLGGILELVKSAKQKPPTQ